MKIDWLAQSVLSIYLLIGASIVAIVWTYFDWPWAGVVKVIPLFFAAYGFLVAHLVKRARLKGEQLKKEIRELSDDLTLQDDFTVDDLDALYEVEELEQIVATLKAMPIGQRKLQDAVEAIEKNQVQDKE